MSDSLYARPSHNLIATATVSVKAGGEDPTYPAANLADLNPAKPAKLLAATGSWLIDFGAPQCLDVVACIHHNLKPGTATLTLKANATDAWATPTLSQVVTIPADDADGYPRNPWLDLKTLHPLAADRTFRYWLVEVAANDANVALGELLMCDELLEFELSLAPGMGDEEEQPIVEHRTDHGVSTIYHLGPKWRRWTGELNLTTSIAAFRALYQDARGRARGFLFIPDPDVNDAWFVRFDSTKYSAIWNTAAWQRHTIGFEEVSRGLPL